MKDLDELVKAYAEQYAGTKPTTNTDDWGEEWQRYANDRFEASMHFKAGYTAAVDGGEWIDVKDGLPNPGITVLAYPVSFAWLSGNEVGERRVYNDCKGGVYFGESKEKITHWRPLPGPPNRELSHLKK